MCFLNPWTPKRSVFLNDDDALTSRTYVNSCSNFCSLIFWYMQLPDYHEIIEHPMDFGTVRKKVSGGTYANLEQFEVGYHPLVQSFQNILVLL